MRDYTVRFYGPDKKLSAITLVSAEETDLCYLLLLLLRLYSYGAAFRLLGFSRLCLARRYLIAIGTHQIAVSGE